MKYICGIVVVLALFAALVEASFADICGGPFEFIVSDASPHAEAPDSLSGVFLGSSINLLFGLKDISEYQKSTHTIVLKAEAVRRLDQQLWWKRLNHIAGINYFYVHVNGERIYSGRLFSMLNSSVPGPGITVWTPTLVLGGADRLSIELVEPYEDLRNDPRVLRVLGEAGLLVE